MHTKNIRAKIQIMRAETEGLASQILTRENSTGHSQMLKRLQEQQYALRTYETYLNDLEEKSGASGGALRQEVEALEKGVEYWTRELKAKLATIPKEFYLGLSFYIIDQKKMASEKLQVLGRLAKTRAVGE